MPGKSDQGLAFNELHGQKEFAGFGNTAVDQLGNVWVIQRGENLTFAAKVSFQFTVGETLPNDLQGDLLFECAVSTCRQKYRTHAATSKLAQDGVRTETFAKIFVAFGLKLAG